MTFRAIDPAITKIYYAEEADRPITTLNIPDGSLVIFTDSGLEDSFDGVANAWFNREQITQNAVGKTAGLMVAELSPISGILETRTFTINAPTDCFTDKAAPLIAELMTADGFTPGKKRCRITLHVQGPAAATQIPEAELVVVTLNAGDDATAVSRLTYVDIGADGTGSVDTRQRMISPYSPVIEFDLTKTEADIDRVDLGGYLPAGTGVLPIYILVEVW